MPQQDTPIALCGKQINALFGDSVADEDKIVSVLDDAIPLQGASHAEVSEYVVESPMRYAECFAVMANYEVAVEASLRRHAPAAVDTYSFAKVDKIASNTSTSPG